MRFDPKEDGITHINIYSKSLSRLGRVLSNWCPCEITISKGTFKSIEGLIYYLGSRDYRLKTAVGYEAKLLGKQLDKGHRLPEKEFKAIISEAMRAKLMALNPELIKEFKESTVPFTHYYCWDNKIITVDKWYWQIEEWENIRKELKNGTFRKKT